MARIPAEALLGRPVVNASGLRLGVVLDVGTGELGAPKFLLIGDDAARPAGLVRVEMRDVAEVAPVELRLRPA